MKILVASLVFVAVYLLSPIVFSQPCPPVDVNLAVADQAQEWWMVLLDFLVQLSAPLVTTILGVLGAHLVRKLSRKWDVEKQEAAARLTENLVTAGVAFAEEQARKALRHDQVRTQGADKMKRAVDFVQQQLDSSGLPGVAERELVALIEARLQAERAKPDGVVPSDFSETLPFPPPPSPSTSTES